MAKLLLPCAENIVTQWVHFPQQASIFHTIVNLLTAKMQSKNDLVENKRNRCLSITVSGVVAESLEI